MSYILNDIQSSENETVISEKKMKFTYWTTVPEIVTYEFSTNLTDPDSNKCGFYNH